MKRVPVLIAVLFLSLTAICQEPESFNYQALVRDDAGRIVAGKEVTVKFTILRGSVNGDNVYSEKQKTVTGPGGLISVSVGEGTDKAGDIKSITWTSDEYFLKVEIDISGNTKFTDMGTTQILVVPDLWRPEKGKKTTPEIIEDELVIVRKYVGRFLDFRHTGSDTYSGPNLLWIKTTMENIYGKISAYGKNCDFSAGDNLYIKRILYAPGGISAYWIYQIENDSSVYYRVTDFQNDKKVFVEGWFE